MHPFLFISIKADGDSCRCVCVNVGTLQIRYSLGGLTEPFTIDVDRRNMANGQPHSVNITRSFREIQLQVSVTMRRSS